MAMMSWYAAGFESSGNVPGMCLLPIPPRPPLHPVAACVWDRDTLVVQPGSIPPVMCDQGKYLNFLGSRETKGPMGTSDTTRLPVSALQVLLPSILQEGSELFV